MAKTGASSVILLSMIVTIMAPAFGGATEWDLSALSSTQAETVKTWKRQDQQSKVAQEKLTKSKTAAMGGPGMDGGGGVSVLGADGRPRLLDMAVGERTPVKVFDRDSYVDIMTRKSSYATDVGVAVSAEAFFGCALRKISAQDNLVLKALSKEQIQMFVVMTEMPLDQASLRLSQVNFPSPDNTGWTYTVKQLPKVQLASPTMPLQYQKPIASYAIQAVTGLMPLPSQTLLVSQQMYSALSESDRCALQVHELMRYLSNFGKFNDGSMIPLFVEKELTSSQIEDFTRKIMWGQPIGLNEIPATDFMRVLAIFDGDISKSLQQGVESKELQDLQKVLLAEGIIEDPASPDRTLGISTAIFLYQSMMDTRKNMVRVEQGMMSVDQRYSYYRSFRRQQDLKLRAKKVNLKDYIR